MKLAFTLLELVVVIVLIGILSSVAIWKFKADKLVEATDQVVSHIRYTQHLAMQDNKFKVRARNGEVSKWYRQRWNLAFQNEKSWKYTVFYDIDSKKPNEFSGNLNSNKEVAKDPANNSKFLSAGWSGISKEDCEQASQKFNLGKIFGIIDVKFSKNCGNRAKTLSFDEFGRPMQPVTATGNGGAQRGYDKILLKRCEITLKTDSKQSIISIEPITGFLSVKYISTK